MSLYQLIPLAPAGLLMLGALLILAFGLVPDSHHRRWLVFGVAAAVMLGQVAALLAASSGAQMASSAPVSWLEQPGLSFRLAPLNPETWVVVVSVVAALLALPLAISRHALSGAALVSFAAAFAYLLVLSEDIHTLALTLFAFDAAVAVLLLAWRYRGLALARLLLGSVQIAVLMGIALTSPPGKPGLELGGIFSLLVWVRLGLYPLIEAGKIERGESMPLTLVWHALQLAVGLYLLQTGFASWLLWPAVGTSLLHAVLAWLGKSKERSMAHSVYAMASMVMVGLALGPQSSEFLAAAVFLPLALLAVTLTCPRTGGLSFPRSSRDWLRLWNYVPLALASLALAGVPWTLGNVALGGVFGLSWERQLIGIFLLLVLAQGAGLSVVYRYWRTLGRPANGDLVTTNRVVAASLAAVPFLVPFLGWQIYMNVAVLPQNVGNVALSIGEGIGLGGTLVWALFLGYSQPVVLRRLPWRRHVLFRWLRLEPVVGFAVAVCSFAGRVLLRLRVIFEGAHYLSWAVLLVIFGILLALVFSTSILP